MSRKQVRSYLARLRPARLKAGHPPHPSAVVGGPAPAAQPWVTSPEIDVEDLMSHNPTMLLVAHVRSTRRSRRRRSHRSRCCPCAKTRIWGVRTPGTMSALGDGISRDPLEEDGGLNSYGMLDNAPISFVDLFGLAGELTTLPLRRPIPENERGCCDDDTVKRGEDELNKHYEEAKDAAKKRRLKPAGMIAQALQLNDATCKATSTDVLEYLVPTPPCWQCYEEERNYYSKADDPRDERWDHRAIICVGYSKSGSKKEIIFDWWGDTSDGVHQSGGPPDEFRKKYRYPARNTENNYWRRCSDGKPNDTPPACSNWGDCHPPRSVEPGTPPTWPSY
jgi:hypothetical protein